MRIKFSSTRYHQATLFEITTNINPTPNIIQKVLDISISIDCLDVCMTAAKTTVCSKSEGPAQRTVSILCTVSELAKD